MGCVTRGVIINNVALSRASPLTRAVSQFLVKATQAGNRKKNTVPLDLISIWAPVCVGGWFGVRAKNSGSCQSERRPNAWREKEQSRQKAAGLFATRNSSIEEQAASAKPTSALSQFGLSRSAVCVLQIGVSKTHLLIPCAATLTLD
jgi:hypothetical protein